MRGHDVCTHMRRYDEEVAVRTSAEHPGEEQPEAFVWRGRLYAVHLVRDRWVQRRPWWRLAFQAGADEVEPPARRSGIRRASGEAKGGSAEAGESIEEDIWRVEAAIGRAADARSLAGFGIYDLVRSSAGWRLVSVGR